MTQQAAKHSVAWFKIAEFVSRGEKERALAVFRLLAHTLEDQAFVQQLEADILLAFHDEIAFEQYAKSARLYIEHSKFSEAAAVYEHLIALEPTTEKQLGLLVDLFNVASTKAGFVVPMLHAGTPRQTVIAPPEMLAIRMADATQHYFRCLLGKKEFEKVSGALQQLDAIPGIAQTFNVVHQELVTAWLKIEDPPTDSLRVHVRRIIDHYFGSKQQKSLQTFLMTLKMLHSMLYQDACFYMQEIDLGK